MNIDFIVVWNSVSTLFFLLLIGYVLRKINWIDESFSKKLSNLIMCAAQPFLIVTSLLKVSYSQENLKTGGTILLFGFIAHGILCVLSYFLVMRFRDLDERKLTEFSLIFANCGFIGFPILDSIFGNIGVFYGSFYVVVFNLVVWTYGMVLLGRNRKDIKINPFKMFINYGTIPCVIGILLYVLQIPIPTPIFKAMDYMGSLCTPLSLLVIGGLLATVPLKKIFTSGKIYYFCALKLLILPLIFALLCRLLHIEGMMAFFLVTMVALPTAANTGMFAEMYDIKPGYAAQTVGMSTLFCVGTVPFVLYLSDLILKI